MKSLVYVGKRLSVQGPMFLSVLLLSACGREEIKVYRVAKEEAPPAPPSQTMPAGHADAPVANPQLSWTLPAGWQETSAGRMSVATFNIIGADGKQAQVTVTPLRGLAGKEVLIVNMWRQQVGQSELSEAEVGQQLKPVEIGNEPGKMFEIAGKADGAPSPVQIVTAMQHRGDTSWFYKLAGDANVVEAQKPAFVAFLKSIKLGEAATPPVATTPVPAPKEATATASASSEWKVPADWKSVSPGPMQNAKFAVPEKDGAKAEVTISIFPNSTGGALSNVNRWRGQIGLSSIDEAELGKIAVRLDDKNPDAVLVDMVNGSRQLIAAVTTRDGQWFFYKLVGDAGAVAPQKEAFVAFVKAHQ